MQIPTTTDISTQIDLIGAPSSRDAAAGVTARQASAGEGSDASPPAALQALSRNSSGSPVSTRLLRLDKIIGQPGVRTVSSDPPGSSPR